MKSMENVFAQMDIMETYANMVSKQFLSSFQNHSMQSQTWWAFWSEGNCSLLPSCSISTQYSKVNSYLQNYRRLRYLLHVKGFVITFYLGWSGSILQFRWSIIKVVSKSWLLTCSSNITWSVTSYTGSALKRRLSYVVCCIFGYLW